jgi:hypothetical protein
MMQRALLGAAVAVLLTAGCAASASPGVVGPSAAVVVSAAPTAASTPSPTPAPSPFAEASPSATTTATPSPVAISIVACQLDDATGDAGDPSVPTPGPPPTSLTPGLPATLVPDGATVYALSLPIYSAEPGVLFDGVEVIYTVAPTGSRCSGMRGNYVAIEITDPAGKAAVSVFLPGSAGPNLMVSCAYIPAATETYRLFREGSLEPGASLPPGPPEDCRAIAGEEVVSIATGVKGHHLALVLSPAASGSAEGERTIALYTFVEESADSTGAGSTASCTLPASQRAICVASLGFFLAQAGVGIDMTEARRAEVYRELAAILAR